MNSSLPKSDNNQDDNRVEIGIIQSNTNIPFPIGAIGNKKTFNYSVRYQFVEELTTQRLVVNADPSLDESIIKAARLLEHSGVSAILGDCGHLIQFQQAVNDSVNIPVFLSSWLQLPFIQSILPSGKKIGALMANAQFFRPHLLEKAGIDLTIDLQIIGMEHQPAFRQAYIEEPGNLNTQAVTTELVDSAMNLLSSEPDIGALILECSDMPPYALAIRHAMKIPVFDFLTMANYVFASLDRNG